MRDNYARRAHLLNFQSGLSNYHATVNRNLTLEDRNYSLEDVFRRASSVDRMKTTALRVIVDERSSFLIVKRQTPGNRLLIIIRPGDQWLPIQIANAFLLARFEIDVVYRPARTAGPPPRQPL